ncbi:MAG: acyltransferase [Pseudomonadota bacterium]
MQVIVDSPETLTTSTSQPKNFLNNIHSLRALAIFLIVSGHTLGEFPWRDLEPLMWMLDILENGTIIFVFVAGYLFHHLHHRFQFKIYIQKKCTSVILPYLIVSLPAIFLATKNNHAEQIYSQLAGHSLFYQYAWFYIKGGAHLNYALWFIPMIAIFYLAAPLFMHFIKCPRYYYLIIPFTMLSLLIKRTTFPNLNTFHLAIYTLPAYLLGMWCSQFGEQAFKKFEAKPLLNWFLIVGVWVSPLMIDSYTGNYVESGYLTFDSGLIDWLFAQKLILAVLLTIAFKHLPNQMHRLVAPLAETSFAIFFVHLYWLLVLDRLLAPYQLEASIFLWFIFSVIILGLSHLIALSFRFVFKERSKYLIAY